MEVEVAIIRLPLPQLQELESQALLSQELESQELLSHAFALQLFALQLLASHELELHELALHGIPRTSTSPSTFSRTPSPSRSTYTWYEPRLASRDPVPVEGVTPTFALPNLLGVLWAVMVAW
jgi:hypothetical protein